MASGRDTYAFDIDGAVAAAKRWAGRRAQHTSFQAASFDRRFSKLDSDARLAKRANRLLTRLNQVAPEKSRDIAFDLRMGAAASSQVMRSEVTEETIASREWEPFLERVMGATRDFQSVEFLDRAVYVARSVCRITTALEGGARTHATGFLVTPHLLLTNHHVLESRAIAARSIAEFDYQRDRFGRAMKVEAVAFAPDQFFLADAGLDFALVALHGSPGARFGWCPLLREEGKAVVGEPVNIIQHPRGDLKQIVIRANRVIDLLDGKVPFLHYEADTEPGSSGSPVFNDQWEVIALHHSGVPKRNARGVILGVDDKPWKKGDDPFRLAWVGNEGVRVSRLVAFLVGAPVRPHETEMLAEALKPIMPPTDAVEGVPFPHPPRGQNGSMPEAIHVTVPVTVRVSSGTAPPRPLC